MRNCKSKYFPIIYPIHPFEKHMKLQIKVFSYGLYPIHHFESIRNLNQRIFISFIPYILFKSVRNRKPKYFHIIYPKHPFQKHKKLQIKVFSYHLSHTSFWKAYEIANQSIFISFISHTSLLKSIRNCKPKYFHIIYHKQPFQKHMKLQIKVFSYHLSHTSFWKA